MIKVFITEVDFMSSVCSDSLARSPWHLMFRSCEVGSAMGEGDFLNTIVTNLMYIRPCIILIFE